MTTNLSKQDRLPQIRVFVALELSEDLRAHLSRLQSQFGAAADAATWVDPDLLHVTMRFLGEIAQDRLESVEAAARAAVKSTDPFMVDVGRLGAFPHERNPRVLWMGLEGEAGLAALQRLHAALERNLDEHGFGREDKSFSPHITVARHRERSGSDGRRALGAALMDVRRRPTGPQRSFPVEALTVMRSDLRSSGPLYTPLARIPLAVALLTADTGAFELLSEEQ
jgi:RNA 2',3'-cyclic 3'-phosphodiesterase